MRKIKFRAWSGDAMEYGGFSIHATGKVVPIEVITSVTKDSPIMQFTGLFDKNGEEIWEGDIIKGDDGLHDYVLYSNGEFILMPQDDNCVYWELCEIIGNIYANPELLETT